LIGVNAVKTSIKLFTLLACLPLIALADTLRCGEKLITQGTTQSEVLARCGQPTQVERQTINNSAVSPVGPAGLPGPAGPPPGIARTETESSAEIWTYNFGPDRLMERIRLENGVVVRIDSAGYGF
jgi:hypothetical protein